MSMRIRDCFEVKSGDFHSKEELGEGLIPLISCGDSENGCIGYFDIPADKVYRGSITVAYNGQPLTTKFHPYPFGAKDDVAVLMPLKEYRDTTLYYIASIIDRNKWRYSYGRKCFREKLSNLTLALPSVNGQIDEDGISKAFYFNYRDFMPLKSGSGVKNIPCLNWRLFSLSDIFKTRRGDFHSIADLAEGEYTTVSRVSSDNGVVGNYEIPDDAKKYQKGCVTISTVGGDAFVQLDEFIATDNVIVCTPKSELSISTLFFVAFVLNRQKWRYSYGRQCYMNKVGRINFYLPVKAGGEIDETGIAKVVERTAYWGAVKAIFS